MKTLYIIGAVVGAVAVGAAAYGGYRMLRAAKDAEKRAITGGTQTTEQPVQRLSGLSLVNRDFTVPVIRGRLSVDVNRGGYVSSTPVETVDVNRAGQPIYSQRMTRGEEQHSPGSVQWTDVDTTENAGRPRQSSILRTNVLMLR